MKNLNLTGMLLLLLSVFLLGSCSAIAGIFKAGVGTGIFIVVFIIVVIALIIFRSRKK